MITNMFLSIWGHVSYFLNDFKVFLVILIVSFILLLLLISKIFKSNRSDLAKKILMVFVFSAFLFVLIYSGFEAYFRYRYDQSDGLGFLNTNVRWQARHVVFNNYQFRDRDFSIAKDPKTVRIGVIGDSLAMGYGIKNVDDRFSNLLEEKLKDKGLKAEVYNIGTSGMDTCSEIPQFEKYKQLNFDLMVWEYYPNDIQPCGASTGAKIITKQFSDVNPIVEFLSNQSFLFDYLYWRLTPTYSLTFRDLRLADLAQFTNQKSVDRHKKYLATFSTVLQDNTTTHKVVVIVFPFLFLLNKNYQAIGVHNMLDKYLKEQNNIVIDMTPKLINIHNKKLMVNRFDSHPNEYVNSIAANALYDKIEPLVASLSATRK